MKKNWLVRILLLIGYCVPYAFLSINGDATSGVALREKCKIFSHKLQKPLFKRN